MKSEIKVLCEHQKLRWVLRISRSMKDLKISNVFIVREFVGLNYIDTSPNFMMSHRYRVKIMGTGVIP
jgi:hypothetical protein